MVIESILTKFIAAYTVNVDISGVPQFTRNTLKSIRLGIHQHMAYLRYQLSNIHFYIVEITLTKIVLKFQLHNTNNIREYPLPMFTKVYMKYLTQQKMETNNSSN